MDFFIAQEYLSGRRAECDDQIYLLSNDDAECSSMPTTGTMPKNRDDVFAILAAHTDTLRRLGVRRLGLFGSCARGEATANSDLDFVVDFAEKSFDAYMDLKAYLEDLFGCRVDLVLADTIKPRLRPIIQRETVYAQGL
jgi:hypothetical protein